MPPFSLRCRCLMFRYACSPLSMPPALFHAMPSLIFAPFFIDYSSRLSPDGHCRVFFFRLMSFLISSIRCCHFFALRYANSVCYFLFRCVAAHYFRHVILFRYFLHALRFIDIFSLYAIASNIFAAALFFAPFACHERCQRERRARGAAVAAAFDYFFAAPRVGAMPCLRRR